MRLLLDLQEELMRQINLLPRKEAGDLTSVRRTHAAEATLLIGFISCALATAGIWFWALNLSSQIQTSQQQIAALQERISARSSREQKIQLLANRLKSAGSIITSRPNFDKELDQIAGALPHDVHLASAELEKSGKTATLKLQSSSYSGFRDLMAALQTGGFPRVDVKQFSRDHAGVYSVELVLALS